MTSTMESHNTMQEASDQQARCKKQQKTRHTCHHECRGHTPTCTPQPAHPNLHFDSAKHAYITNNRSKAEPEILSALLPWQLCFSRQARLWFSSHAQQAPNCVFKPHTTSTKGFKFSTPRRLQHVNALTSHSLPYSEPLQRATTAWRDQPGVASKASGGLLHADSQAPCASRTRCPPQPSPRKQHS